MKSQLAKYTLFFVPVLIGTTGLMAQRSFIDNLVKNSGFEEYRSCPTRLGSFDKDVRYWNCPTLGSTDYFSACSEVMTVPRNYNGSQEPRNGRAYAGMYLLAPKNYREYIQVGLRKRLVRDSVYHLKLSISLAETSDAAVGQLGFLFTDTELRLPIKTVLHRGLLDSIKPLKKSLSQVVVPEFREGSTDWQEVEFHYRARGFERFLTIGNFLSDSLTTIYPNPQGWKPGSYYYIDRFTLFEVKSGQAQPNYRLDTTYIFEDILFDFDRHELDSSGLKDVENMYYYLRERPGHHIYISGHTDNLGSDQYNLRLSALRSERIARELVRLGIPKERVHVRSFGSECPVASNGSDQGRQLNRRAEFVLRLGGGKGGDPPEDH